jgi:hypothetical protein
MIPAAYLIMKLSAAVRADPAGLMIRTLAKLDHLQDTEQDGTQWHLCTLCSVHGDAERTSPERGLLHFWQVPVPVAAAAARF